VAGRKKQKKQQCGLSQGDMNCLSLNKGVYNRKEWNQNRPSTVFRGGAIQNQSIILMPNRTHLSAIKIAFCQGLSTTIERECLQVLCIVPEHQEAFL
jgi:hypothetical protein